MIEKWHKLKEESCKVGFRKLFRRTYRMPDGREELFDIKDEGESVSILALTDKQEVIIARQYRPGPSQVVDDLPCGAIEKNETAMEAAQRELLEETGYSGELREIGICYECGYSTKIRHNFIAINCKKIQEPELDKNEFIETTLLSLEDFRSLLRSGKSTVIETGYMGLDALGLL